MGDAVQSADVRASQEPAVIERVSRTFRRRYRELSERDVSLAVHPHGHVLVFAAASAVPPINEAAGAVTPLPPTRKKAPDDRAVY